MEVGGVIHAYLFCKEPALVAGFSYPLLPRLFAVTAP